MKEVPEWERAALTVCGVGLVIGIMGGYLSIPTDPGTKTALAFIAGAITSMYGIKLGK